MKGFIENKVLETSEFPSASIGPLGYLIRKLTGEGSYTLEISQNDKAIHRAEVISSKEFSSTSENIDLEALNTKSGLPSKIRLNSENGYLLFYNSVRFAEYHILILKGKQVEFDSKKLGKGDMYALNLMKPGTYELHSKSLKLITKVEVAYPSLEKENFAKIGESTKINSGNNKDVNLLPNQGLVIEFDDKLTDFNIKLTKEMLPKKGQSLSEQLKTRMAELVKNRKRGAKGKSLHKFHYEYK